jgi:hypothetical protein
MNYITFSEDSPPNSRVCPLTRAGNAADTFPLSLVTLAYAASNSRLPRQ